MKSLVERINKFLDGASLILIVLMVVLVWAQVFMRYLLNFSPFWIEAAARYMMIWSLLMAAIVLVGKDKHVRVDFVMQLYTPKMAKIISIVLSFVTLIFLLVEARDPTSA